MKPTARMEVAAVVQTLRTGGYIAPCPIEAGLFWLFPAYAGTQHENIADVSADQLRCLVNDFGVAQISTPDGIARTRRFKGLPLLKTVYMLPTRSAPGGEVSSDS